MNIFIRQVLFLVVISLTFVSCSDERKISKKMDAIWTLTSYKVFNETTNEEVEFLGLHFNKGTFEFDNYDLSTSMGDFDLILEDAIMGEEVITDGTFMVSEDGEEVTLFIDDSEDNISMVNVDKDKIKIEGLIDGAKVKIEGEKR